MLPEWLQSTIENTLGKKVLIENLDEILEPNESIDIWNKNFPEQRLPIWFLNIDSNTLSESWIYSFLENADEELIEFWLKNGLLKDDPIWLNELTQKQANDVARVFLLSGNVNDYGYSPSKGYMPILDLISENAQTQRKIVFRYSLSNHFGGLKEIKADTDNNVNTPSEMLRDYLQASGSERSNQSTGIWERVQKDFKFIDSLLNKRFNEGVCIIIEHADILFPQDARELERNVLVEFLLNWAVAPWMFQSNNQVILLTETVNELSNNLKSQANKIEIIDIKRPETKEERLKFLLSIKASEARDVVNQDNLRIKTGFSFPVLPNLDVIKGNELSVGLDNAADKSSGLNYLGLEDLLLQTRNQSGELSINTITKVKGKILQNESAGLIELVEAKQAFDDVGGFKKIKSRLKAISKAMLNKGSSKLTTRTIPMGILFLGPPGTGKTLIAQAFANECNTNFVKLGDFRSMWVGQSERNLTKALDLIRSLSPVIVFMDEIDQSEGSRGESGDSGVGKRIFSKLLQFMSDTSLRGKVLWIAASNRPDLIDAALKRAGRFDMTIPFFLPEIEARKEIFKIHLERNKKEEDRTIDTSTISEENWTSLAEATNGFTGAEIQVIANETIRRVIHNKNINSMPLIVERDDIAQVLDIYTPTLNRGIYYKMMALALQDINFIDVLPDAYKNIRKQLLEHPHLINSDDGSQLKELFKNIQ